MTRYNSWKRDVHVHKQKNIYRRSIDGTNVYFLITITSNELLRSLYDDTRISPCWLRSIYTDDYISHAVLFLRFQLSPIFVHNVSKVYTHTRRLLSNTLVHIMCSNRTLEHRFLLFFTVVVKWMRMTFSVLFSLSSTRL